MGDLAVEWMEVSLAVNSWRSFFKLKVTDRVAYSGVGGAAGNSMVGELCLGCYFIWLILFYQFIS